VALLAALYPVLTGTRVTVRNLFFNVPARLKYLKTNATELAQIGDILTRLALANPHVAMRFHSGRTQVFATPGNGDLLDTATVVLGREVTRELLPVFLEEPHVRIRGFVGRPSLARAGRTHQYFFVNSRVIRQFPARYALEEAYAHLLPQGRYPVCIIFVDVPPSEVDVNVHPAKAEVRFERDREVRAALYRAARETLGAHLLIPGTTVTPDGEVVIPDRAGEKAAAQESAAPPATPGWKPPVRQVSFQLHRVQTIQGVADEPAQYELPPGGLAAVLESRRQPGAAPPDEGTEALWTAGPEPLEMGALIRSLRPLGQVHRSYIVCDGPEGLYVIDQHAAHERIFFERLYAAAREAEPPVQPLLFPIALDLTPAQMALWQENADIFRESGLMAEPFGGNTLLIKGMPAGLGEADAARLVSDFLDRLQEERAPAGAPVSDRRQRVLAAMAACKAAIKARDALQPEDIQALLADLAACAAPATCPHGRPTVICISKTELEKRFRR